MNRPRVLVTLGPTVEDIDPVRFISNRSTGVMGLCLIRAAKKKGLAVEAICGPVEFSPIQGVVFHRVRTADEMLKVTLKRIRHCDILFMTAAVSDFRIKKFSNSKIKKTKKNLTLTLVPNTDILAEIKRRIKERKIKAAFSVESSDILRHARRKIFEKDLDIIVSQKVGRGNHPFGEVSVRCTIVEKGDPKGTQHVFSKHELASWLIRKVWHLWRSEQKSRR